ncbi:hypothetical protein CYLTODRAFT_441480 [Cylindrobasidium torrendii FP15055 ss-10]|uniref:RING-type domain-containing protein n=1 Tax=Cylindrobasidium torrendii FP15055 ss-10 TaxID=1314674 RepID=A0A0D7BKT5_9AGAR|nr:hypothetical protein CYLTODRAFT_441480 [Cylindrobasidium torrendii FP15055 ss-10]
MPPTRASNRTKRASPIGEKRGSRSAAAANDVIVISSDDEEDAPPKSTTNKNVVKLESQIKRMKKDNEKLLSELSSMKSAFKKTEVARQEAETKAKLAAANVLSGSSPAINTDKLEDITCCEICTGKMWAPFILPDCGHVFCQNCLQGWFATTKRQYQTAHPQHLPNAPVLLPQWVTELVYYRNTSVQQLHDVVTPLLQQDKPDYNCPTCRKSLKTRPVECFAIKSLVSIVAAAEGESSPKKDPPRKTGRGRNKAPPTPPTPFAEFFP